MLGENHKSLEKLGKMSYLPTSRYSINGFPYPLYMLLEEIGEKMKACKFDEDRQLYQRIIDALFPLRNKSRAAASMEPWELTEAEAASVKKALEDGTAKPKFPPMELSEYET